MNESYCISVDILGEWIGEYEGGGIATLNITKCDEKGTIEGVYGFTPATIGFTRQEGSYQVSGQLDFTTLEMNLVAGDWVKEAVYTGYAVNEKRGIKAILNINDSSIEGNGHRGLKFKVSK